MNRHKVKYYPPISGGCFLCLDGKHGCLYKLDKTTRVLRNKLMEELAERQKIAIDVGSDVC